MLNQIGEALLYAHQQKIVHGDLKPENILFNAQGEVVVADFWIATVLSTMSHQQLADLKESSPYMTPEQFKGKVSKKSDQYALGCLAYEMLTGQLPQFISELGVGGRQRVRPLPPRQINANILPYSEEAIIKALAERRGHRHNDLTTFLKDLQTPPSPYKITRGLFSKGATLIYQQRYEEAVQAYEQIISLNPKLAGAYANMGDALIKLERYEEAVKAYDQAIVP